MSGKRVPQDNRTRRAWEWPDCPNCNIEIFVGKAMYQWNTPNGYTRYRCEDCGKEFISNEYDER